VLLFAIFICHCRLSNPDIRRWMLDHNILSTTNLHKYYADRILDITRNISITPIVWQDVWDEHVQVNPRFVLLEFLSMNAKDSIVDN
jgi:hypothetical protein